jgi:hypothetical protein
MTENLFLIVQWRPLKSLGCVASGGRVTADDTLGRFCTAILNILLFFCKS